MHFHAPFVFFDYRCRLRRSSQLFWPCMRHRDAGGSGVAGCDAFLQRDRGRLSRAVYRTLKRLWEVESALPAVLSHRTGTFY